MNWVVVVCGLGTPSLSLVLFVLDGWDRVWPMLSVVGMASHDETLAGEMDNKDAIIVEEALAEELQGDDGVRHYKKGMWTVSELLVLQAVRREDFERQAKGGSREKHR